MVSFNTQNASGRTLRVRSNQHRNGPGEGCGIHILEKECA